MPRILLIEDNEMNREILSRRLRREGFEVETAVDGREGVDFARARPPDLVLMDMSLPVLDGYEATRLLKADPVTSGIPVVALTARAMAGDRERSLGAGCDEYETKPVDLARLVGKIRALLPGGPAAAGGP